MTGRNMKITNYFLTFGEKLSRQQAPMRLQQALIAHMRALYKGNSVIGIPEKITNPFRTMLCKHIDEIVNLPGSMKAPDHIMKELAPVADLIFEEGRHTSRRDSA